MEENGSASPLHNATPKPEAVTLTRNPSSGGYDELNAKNCRFFAKHTSAQLRANRAHPSILNLETTPALSWIQQPALSVCVFLVCSFQVFLRR